MQPRRVRGRAAVRLKEASVQALHEASEALKHAVRRKPHMLSILRSTVAASVRHDRPPRAHAAQGGVNGACLVAFPWPSARGMGLGERNHTRAPHMRAFDFIGYQRRARGAPWKSVVAFARHRPQRKTRAASLSTSDLCRSAGIPLVVAVGVGVLRGRAGAWTSFSASHQVSRVAAAGCVR